MNRTPLPAEFGFDAPPSLIGPRLHASRDVRSIIAAVRRHVVPLVVWIAIAVAAAAAYVVASPAEYVASTLVLFEPQRPASGGPAASDAVQSPLDAAQADSRMQIIKSERLLRFIFDSLDLASTPDFAPRGLDWRARLTGLLFKPSLPSPSSVKAQAFLDFMSRVGARRVGQSYVVEISYRAFDPEAATRTIDSITSAFLWDRIASEPRSSELLQSKVSSLKAQEEAALDGMRHGTIPAARFPDADVRVIGAAIEPAGKSFPKTRLVLAFALAFGLTTGLGVIVTLHSFDRRIRTRRDLQANFDLPCLAVLPSLSAQQRRAARRGQALDRASAYLDALRALRPAVIHPTHDKRHSAVGIVSWRRREGRSTIANCLAQLVAGMAEPVVLVDADLRRPDLTRLHTPFEARGLTESLLARDPPWGVTTVRIDKDFCFVPAVGAHHPISLDAFLGLPEMHDIFTALKADATVIVDLPSVDSSSDAQAVMGMLDGIILVVRAGQTTLDEIADLLTSIHVARANVLGVVLNGAS